MPSEKPSLMLRVASAEEKKLIQKAFRLSGARDLNAWALPILRREVEAILRERSPADLPKFVKARMKGGRS